MQGLQSRIRGSFLWVQGSGLTVEDSRFRVNRLEIELQFQYSRFGVKAVLGGSGFTV